MRIRELLTVWNQASGTPQDDRELRVRLPLSDTAKLAALTELFPRRSEEQLLSELLSAALWELQESFPYVQSKQILTLDEEGDPVFADAGLGPRFHQLSLEYLKRAQTGARQPQSAPDGAVRSAPLTPEKEDRQALGRAENEGLSMARPSPSSSGLH